MNQRPSGYEPDELPDCSIPRPINRLKHGVSFTMFNMASFLTISRTKMWLREPDLNQRPSGYEPDELPDCSIPRPIDRLKHGVGFAMSNMASFLTTSRTKMWLREPDLNQRPSGYEPDELPDCSIPRPIDRLKHGVGFAMSNMASFLTISRTKMWLREPDLNQRPSGYEPDELPDCSIPRPIDRLKHGVGFAMSNMASFLTISRTKMWLREPDLNQRPSGYEPDELPDCSIPRPINRLKHGVSFTMLNMASFITFRNENLEQHTRFPIFKA